MAVSPTVRINVTGARGPRGAASGPLADGSVDAASISNSDAGQAAILAKIGGASLAELEAQADRVDTAINNIPSAVIDTFENVSASDAGQMRRAIMAASVEALKVNALNFNGNCRISQQYGTTAVTDIGENDADGEELWVIDGHKIWAKGTLRVSSQQVSVSDLPGFTHALKVEATTAQASIGTDFIRHVTVCESSRFLALAWGTLKARDMVRYAWVKTSMAGEYDINILNGDRTVAQAGTFKVDEPNSWQLVKTHFPAVTFASSWDINSVGYRCETSLAGDGSPNLAAASAHYFMVTGEVFLPADYDPGLLDTALFMPNLQENLAACQRYYQKSYNMSTSPGAATQFAGAVLHIMEASVSYASIHVRFGMPMASIPAVTLYSPQTGATGKAYNSNTAADITLTSQDPGAMGFNAVLNGVAVAVSHGFAFHYTADARIG